MKNDQAHQTPSAEATEPEYCFRGSRFEVGKLHGGSLRGRILDEMQAALETLSRGSVLSRERYFEVFHRRYFPWVRRHLPRVEDEVAGLAEGTGLNFMEAFFAAFHGGSASLASGEECTAFYCGRQATKDGHLYLGQTKDTPTPPSRYVTMRVDYRDGPQAVLLNYPGWVANIGLTSRGIAFTGNARYAAPGGAQGYPLSLLKKAILEARSMAEIQNLIDSYPWQDGALLIADTEGEAVCAEFVQGRTHYLRPGADGTFAHSNTVLAPSAQASDCSDACSPSAASRLRAARAILAHGAPFHDFESLRNLAGDHSHSPFSVCLHPSGLYRGSTTAAMIVELDTGRIELAVGQPCTASFTCHTVPRVDP